MPYRAEEAIVESGRSILVVALAGEVIGVDSITGANCWINKLPGGGGREVFIAFRYGALIVSAYGAAVYRLDYATGVTQWRAETAATGRASIVIEPDVIVVAKGGHLNAFVPDGRPLWTHPLPGMGHGSAALAFPNNVAQADDPGSE